MENSNGADITCRVYNRPDTPDGPDDRGGITFAANKGFISFSSRQPYEKCLPRTGIKSSSLNSFPVTGHFPVSFTTFSINLFSNSNPDDFETTGSFGASPETNQEKSYKMKLTQREIRINLLAQNMIL